jgi:hypothetical protein
MVEPSHRKTRGRARPRGDLSGHACEEFLIRPAAARPGTISIRSTIPDRKPQAPQQQEPKGQAVQKCLILPLSPRDDLPSLNAKRAYELYGERWYRDGSALDDWLDAEREVLSQIPSASQVGNGLA